MKQIIILIIVGLCISGASMAQGQKLKGRLIDKDYYPVKNAKVTVKGTNLSTTTDKKGNYFIEDVPLMLDSVRIEKGKKDESESTLMKIRMANQIISKRFSWFVKAGIGFDFITGGSADVLERASYSVGVGFDYKLSKHWALQPALHFVHRDMQGDLDFEVYDDNRYYYSYDTRCAMNSLELPLLFALKYRLGRNLGIAITMGPYVSYGISGTASGSFEYYDPENQQKRQYDVDMFGKRFGGGYAYGIGFEINRILIGASGRVGVISGDFDSAYVGTMIEIGYKF